MILMLDNGTVVVQCGHGTVGVGAGTLKSGEVAIGARELEHRCNVGDSVPNGDDQVIVMFANVESVDVWIRALEAAKELLVRG